jgi:prephenate dehydrogenase
MNTSMRVLEHAVRLVTRAASKSTSATQPGRSIGELENYVKRLRRLAEEGKEKEFYKIFRNAQMKLITVVCEMHS